MTSINRHYIDEFAKESGIFNDHINNGPNAFGEVGYFVSPNVTANLGVTYLDGRIGKKSILEVTDYEHSHKIHLLPWERSLTTTMVALQQMVKYHLPIENINLLFGGGIAWCFGKSVMKSTLKTPEGSISDKSSFTAQGIGFLASTELWHNINKVISFGAEIGYRHLATGDLKDKDNDGYKKIGTAMSLSNYKVSLDFSGPFILGGLRVKI